MEQVFLAPGPKQSDFDALSNTVNTLNTQIANRLMYLNIGQIYGGSSKTFYVENSGKYIVHTIGNDSARTSMTVIYVSGAGSISQVDCITGSSIVLSHNNETHGVTITNNASGATFAYVDCYDGSASVT